MQNQLRFFVIALFVFSGLTSLVYQAIWIRILSLAVGSTSSSISLVLSIFFLGLSGGSYLCGRFSNRIRRPLLAYGILEGLIGAYSVLLIYLLLNFHQMMAFIYPSGSLNLVSHIVKFALVFFLLILPTLCMGATLPLLMRLFVSGNNNSGKSISTLYGINTIGAVIGAFCSGFVLIPAFGLEISNHVMAVINILILASCVLLQRKFDIELIVENVPVSATRSANSVVSTWQQRALLAASAVTGFSSIVAEVVWTKYLGIMLGTNIFGLSLILSLFLLGLAVGSLLLSRFIDRIKSPVTLLLTLLILAIAATLMSTYSLNWMPVLANVIAYYVNPHLSLLAVKSILTAFALILPTTFYGALLPLTIHILTASGRDVSAVTGTAYAINTIGAILGSYLAGVVLIPTIGSALTLNLALGFLIFTAVALILIFSLKARTRVTSGFVLASITLILIFAPGINFKNIIKSAYRQALPADHTLADLLKYFANDYEEFQLVIEGQTAVTSLSHDPVDGSEYQQYYRLKTNGLNESIYDTRQLDVLPKYEALLGLLPYALGRDPQNAFIVGYGGGYTVDFLSSTDLKKVYVAELEEGILKAADYVHKGDNPILKRENLKVDIEDARFVLTAGSGAPFDIIVSQPSHSWLSGVANLFTLEFFELVSSRLTERGIFSQWLNLYNMDVVTLNSILKTFYTVFPHGAVFTDTEDDELIMIGSNSPINFNIEKIAQVLGNPKISRQLSGIPLTNAYDLLAQMTASRKRVLEFTAGSQLNTDRNALAEVRQSQLFYREKAIPPQHFLDQQYVADYSELLKQNNSADPQTGFKLMKAMQGPKSFFKYNRILETYSADSLESPEQLLSLAQAHYEVERYATAFKLAEKSLRLNPQVQALNLALTAALYRRDFNAIQTLQSQFASKSNLNTECLLIEASRLSPPHFENLKRYSSDSKIRQVVSRLPEYEEACGALVHLAVGGTYFKKGNLAESLPYLKAYYDVHPAELVNRQMLIAAYIATERRSEAAPLMSTLSENQTSEWNRLKVLKDFYQKQNSVEDAEALQAAMDRIVEQ